MKVFTWFHKQHQTGINLPSKKLQQRRWLQLAAVALLSCQPLFKKNFANGLLFNWVDNWVTKRLDNWLVKSPITTRLSASLVVVCLLLSGCTPNSDSEFAVYRDRLARTLAMELPAPSPLKAPIPELQPMKASVIEDIRVDLLDMLALDACGVQPNLPSLGNLIAERNSSLGKVMVYSTQLQYEINLLLALEACIHHVEQDSAGKKALDIPSDLRKTLQDIFRQKQQQLTARLMNFLTLDTTLRQQINGSQRPLDLTSGQAVETLQALQNLLRLKQKIQSRDYQAASSIDINQQLALLYQGQILADLQHSLRSNLTQMRMLNTQLNTLKPQWCKSETHDILQQVLLQVFIGKVQQQLAHQDGIAQQLIPILQLLYMNTPLSSEVELRFHQPWQQLHHELKTHIDWWQRLRNSCGR
jgi:hypothetical protein